MKEDLRLAWEPENKTQLPDIEKRLSSYMKNKNSGVSILNNGTLIFTDNGRDDVDDAVKAMSEAKFITNFEVTPLKEGGFFVNFHDTIAVFVGQQEFEKTRNEIITRIKELLFPEEEFSSEEGAPPDHFLVGLYGRGKLQYDANNFNFYARINE